MVRDDARRVLPSGGKEGIMNVTHGAYARNKRLYGIWNGMIHRCEDRKREKFKDYGGRGIKVCDAWHDPNAFIDWALANGYSDGLQIDRKDNSGNYEPNNCRWVTPKENSRNTRRNKSLKLCGIEKTIAEWCETLEISENTIYWWLREYGERGCEKRVYERLAKSI